LFFEFRHKLNFREKN